MSLKFIYYMLKRNYIKYIIIVFLVLNNISVIYGYKIDNFEPIKINDKVGFYDEKGSQHFLDEYEEEVILLVFWAKWSPACMNMLVKLDALQKDLKKLPFKIVAISEDYQGLEIVKKIFDTYKITNLKMFVDPKNRFMHSFNVQTIPMAFLIKEKNKMVASFKDVINWDDEELQNIIWSYLPQDER